MVTQLEGEKAELAQHRQLMPAAVSRVVWPWYLSPWFWAGDWLAGWGGDLGLVFPFSPSPLIPPFSAPLWILWIKTDASHSDFILH